MPQRSRLTIQEMLNDSQMSSSSVRHPVKAKSLTLLELCQTINELQQTSSRNTAQILTRRLYLHPLSVSNNIKQNTSKIIASNLLQLEEATETITPSPRNPTYRGLAILSSSLPLLARTNLKTNPSFNVDHDLPMESEGSTTTFRTNPMSLPVITRNGTSLSSSSRRTTSTRSSFIAIQRKSKSTPPPEKIDVWRHLAQTLQRPPPRDPPTTPLDTYPDLHSHVILPIPSYIHVPTCESPIEEND